MYRHLLVPTDGTEISTLNVTAAVEFARSVGARITFFHANPDYAATGEGALMHAMSPSTFADQVAGRARAILAKAEAAGRAAGVECRSVSTVSDTPAQAILEAADRADCDLIFMASRGRPSMGGLMPGSQTLKVLAGTRVAVLVSQVARNAQHPARDLAIATIEDEHRSLEAVLQALRYLVRQWAQDVHSVDTRLLRGAIHYLRAFPQALHHPKEEQYIFSRLRGRSPDLDRMLEELQWQHVEGARLLQKLEDTVESFDRQPDSAAALREAIEAFAVAAHEHFIREDHTVMPAAIEAFTESDWAQIAEAFSQNGDPRFDRDVDADYRNLFTRIMNLAPVGGR